MAFPKCSCCGAKLRFYTEVPNDEDGYTTFGLDCYHKAHGEFPRPEFIQDFEKEKAERKAAKRRTVSSVPLI